MQLNFLFSLSPDGILDMDVMVDFAILCSVIIYHMTQLI